MLLTSEIGKKVFGIIPGYDSSWETKFDTINNINLIKTDSFNLKIELPSSGVQFYKKGIVFLSQTKNEDKMLSDQLSFGTIEAYYALFLDSVLGKHLRFSPGSSFSFPCEAITFSNDFNTMYFTKQSGEKNHEKIYKAVFNSKDEGQTGWIPELNPQSFCTENANYSHPALSADEKTMIFASDKKDSFGGMDLYVTRNDSNKWSSPVNLGELINTKGNEFYPFLDSDNNLFFSSDRLPGFGGYDIYTCKYNGETWDKPANLFNHINSEDNDVAFTIDKTDGKTAFFSRRKKSGKAETQLFRVTLKKELVNSNLLTISYIFNGKPEYTSRPAAGISDEKIRIARKDSLNQAKIAMVNADTVKTVKAEKKGIRDIIVYKVQILSATTSKKKFQITVNNKIYDTGEYFYLKAYRETVGEFSSYKQALELQNDLRKSGYPQAFVIVFKNNVRTLDPQLFK